MNLLITKVLFRSSVIVCAGFSWICAATLPTYTCKMTKEAIHIDGVLDEKIWGQTDTLKFLENITGGQLLPPRQNTNAFATWDSTNLYVAYFTQDNDVKGVYKTNGSPLWNAGCVELFFDADGDGAAYIELEWNCWNANWQGLMTTSGMQGWTATGMVSAVKVHGTPDMSTDVDTGMTVEVMIPWKALTTNLMKKASLPPKDNDQMRIDFCRINWRTGVSAWDLSAWSPTLNGTYHTPGQFGNIIFSTAAPTAAAQSTNRISSPNEKKGPLMNAINAGPNTVRIMYSVPRQSAVRLTVCTLSGKTAATLTQCIQAKGQHEILWNESDDTGNRINNGAYFVFLQTGGLTKACSVKIAR
jgi:hypothetical protein